eukprot:2977237-Pleurochrysis_carterae.AAC.1
MQSCSRLSAKRRHCGSNATTRQQRSNHATASTSKAYARYRQDPSIIARYKYSRKRNPELAYRKMRTAPTVPARRELSQKKVGSTSTRLLIK